MGDSMDHARGDEPGTAGLSAIVFFVSFVLQFISTLEMGGELWQRQLQLASGGFWLLLFGYKDSTSRTYVLASTAMACSFVTWHIFFEKLGPLIVVGAMSVIAPVLLVLCVYELFRDWWKKDGSRST